MASVVNTINVKITGKGITCMLNALYDVIDDIVLQKVSIRKYWIVMTSSKQFMPTSHSITNVLSPF